MTSSSTKGTYYRGRMRKWLEARGYVVAQLERMHMLRPGKFVKRDQLGADLLAVNGECVLFVQVKMGGESWRQRGLNEARKAFEPFPIPPNAEQWIAVWEVGAEAPLIWRRTHLTQGVWLSMEPQQLALRLPKEGK